MITSASNLSPSDVKDKCVAESPGTSPLKTPSLYKSRWDDTEPAPKPSALTDGVAIRKVLANLLGGGLLPT